MLVVMAGTDPTAPGNVLWSNNRGVSVFSVLLSFLFFAASACFPAKLGVLRPPREAFPGIREEVYGVVQYNIRLV